MRRVHSIQNVVKANIRYLWVWALYYAWVESFATWWTSTPDSVTFFPEVLRNLLMGGTLITTALLACRFQRAWYTQTARVCGYALAVVAGAGLLLLPEQWRIYVAPIQAVLMGFVCLSVLIPFIFILNNTEKLYGMVLGSAAANLYSLIYRSPLTDGRSGRVLAFLLLVLALCAIPHFKEKDLSAGDLVLPPRENRKIAYFSLFINCFYALFIKGVGKLMLDSVYTLTGISPYTWYFAGGILGCAVCLGIFAYVHNSLFTVWNITFTAFLLAALCCAYASQYPALVAVAAVLTGLSAAIGMITLYYNMGVKCRKYRNPKHLQLVLWFGLLGGGGSVLLNLITDLWANHTTVFALTCLTAVGSAAYFITSPLLLRTYFSDDWVNDSETPYADGRFEEMLKQLGLTPRESQICRLLLDGMTMRQIAATLGISQGTVNTHCASLYRKAGIQSKIELVKRMKDTYHL